MAILTFCEEPLISARARIFMAGGPTGSIIMAHQRIGSFGRTSVLAARTQTRGMLILFPINKVLVIHIQLLGGDPGS